MLAQYRSEDHRQDLKASKHLPPAQLSMTLSAASSGFFDIAKSNCHRVEVLLQLCMELDVIWALKAVCCLKSIKTFKTGEMAALKEAQAINQGK